MSGEVGREQSVGRRKLAAPCLEVVEVGAIGSLRCRSDAGLDVRLDLGPEGIIAINCTEQHPAWPPRGVQDDLLRSLGSPICGS